MRRMIRYGGVAALGLFVALCARGHVFASRADEAVFVLLARSLRSGRFSSAGGLGRPVADHLPGFPALIAWPSAALEGRWESYWVLAFFFTLVFVAGVWLLARRLLGSDRAAAATAALCALSPEVLGLSGAVLSDIPFAALTAWLFAGLARAPLPWLCAATAWGAVMRPQGAALLAGVVVGAWRARGRRAALLLAGSGLLPLGAWLARSKFVSGAASDYFPQWALQNAPSPSAVFCAFLGTAPFGATGATGAVWGAALAAAAVAGARALLRGSRRGEFAGLLTFAGALLAMHLTWGSVTPRYGVPLLVVVWTCAARYVGANFSPRVAGLAWGLVATVLVSVSWPLARAGWAGPSSVHAPAMRWIASSAHAGARVESLSCSVVELLSGRPASCPADVEERDAWLASLVRVGAEYVHDFDFQRDGYFPERVEAFARRRRRWVTTWPGFERVYADEESGSAIYGFRAGELRRLSAAFKSFDEALLLAAGGDAKNRAGVRAALDRSVRAAPELALPRAALAELETERSKRVKAFERALARDPESRAIAERLAEAKSAPAR